MPYRIAASIVRRAHGVQAAPQNQNEPELNDAMCEHGSVDFLFFCPVRFPLQPQNRCFWDSPASAAASRRSTSQKRPALSSATVYTSTFYFCKAEVRRSRCFLSGEIKLISGKLASSRHRVTNDVRRA